MKHPIPPSGIMPIARELGELIDAKPIEELPTIRAPMRPSRARWPDKVWAEMTAIYEGRMP